MKLNMKRIALVFCMAACLFSLSACAKNDASSTEIDPQMQQQLEQLPASFLGLYASLPEEEVSDFKKQMERQEGYEALAEGVDSWENVKHDLGALVSIGDTVTIKELDHGYSAAVNAEFEKRNMEFTLTTDFGLTKITSVSFVPEYSIAENMEQGFANMVMGMVTVFVVLIFISLIIACFKYINKFEEKMRQKKQAAMVSDMAPAPVFTPAPAIAAEEENLADDLELAAVITAAIAASTGSSPSGLVVRSIRRAPAGKWKKA